MPRYLYRDIKGGIIMNDTDLKRYLSKRKTSSFKETLFSLITKYKLTDQEVYKTAEGNSVTYEQAIESYFPKFGAIKIMSQRKIIS